MANRQKNGSLFGLSPVVKNIIIINALVWLASVTVFKNSEMLRTLSLHYWESDTFAPFQMITYMFLHDTGNITHLVFNMFNLWMFGCMLENRWGSMRFLTFFKSPVSIIVFFTYFDFKVSIAYFASLFISSAA